MTTPEQCFSTLQIGSLIEALTTDPDTGYANQFQYPSNRVVDRSGVDADFIVLVTYGFNYL